MNDTKDVWAQAKPMLERMLADGRSEYQRIMAAPPRVSWQEAMAVLTAVETRSAKPEDSQENPPQDVPE